MQQTIDMAQTELDFQPGDADKAGGHVFQDQKASRGGGDTTRRPRGAGTAGSNTLAKALAEQMQA